MRHLGGVVNARLWLTKRVPALDDKMGGEQNFAAHRMSDREAQDAVS
ncbi:hypothetical protein [Sagittula sp.]